MIPDKTIATSRVSRQAEAVVGPAGGYALKRAFDLACASLLLLSLLPWLFPLIAFAIALDSQGGVLFVQERNGLHGRVFRCFKFRTMTADGVVTRAGRLLRVSGLDELPQLFNVWKGDMSLVGPRPHMIADNLAFGRVAPRYHERHLVRPGITGLAQVKGYKGTAATPRAICRRVALDRVYIRKQCITLDLWIMLATIRVMLGELVKMKRRK